MAATAETPTTLDALVESIKANCARVVRAEASALDAAIAAGHDLIKAKGMVPGAWLDWVTVNLDIAHSMASNYMRCAHYEAELRESGIVSIYQALALLKDQPATDGNGFKLISEELLDQVRTGAMTTAAAARQAGVSPTTIAKRLGKKPNQRYDEQEKHRRRMRAARDFRARAALRREEEKRAAKKAGGNIQKAFASAVQTEQFLGWAMDDATEADVKAYVATAQRYRNLMHDAIVRASRLS